jgi:glutamate-1-semialdehyde 2,1-aminomutase
MIEREREEFARRHPRSRELHERAAGSLLAGVPMSWMTMWAGAHPVYLDYAEGARLVDVDGNEYADFCLGDTGAMAGHSPPPVRRALREQTGLTTMLPTEDAAWVGEELQRRFGLPPGHRPAARRGLQLVLPRLGRRGVRDAGRLARG